MAKKYEDGPLAYIELGNEYGDAIGINEYNGKYSVISCRVYKGNVYTDWCTIENKSTGDSWNLPRGTKSVDSLEELATVLRELADECENLDGAPKKKSPGMRKPKNDQIPF